MSAGPELEENIRLLNEEFAGWVSQALASTPRELWVHACKDYINHAAKIVQEADTQKAANGWAIPVPQNGAGPGGSQAAAPNAGGSQAAAADAEGSDEEEPTRPVEITDESIIQFRASAKFYSQDEKKGWKDRGRGLLTLRKPGEAGRSPYLVFTMDSGNILLTAALYKGLTLRRGSRPSTVILNLQYDDPSSPGSAPGLRPVLFNLMSVPVADEFTGAVDTGIPG